MWLCNTGVTLACQNTSADEWQCGNQHGYLFEVMFLTHFTLPWLLVCLNQTEKEWMCEPVMKSEDVFFFVVMMNMEMHNSAEEQWFWHFHIAKFCFWCDLWSSRIVFSYSYYFFSLLYWTKCAVFSRTILHHIVLIYEFLSFQDILRGLITFD